MAPTSNADSPSPDADAARIAKLEQELAQVRREVAKGNATLARGIDDIKEAVTPSARARGLAGSTGVRSRVNRRVKSSKFALLLGPGVEKMESFEESWVEFLCSTTGSKAVREELGRTIVQIVNQHGRDMMPSDNEICFAVVYTAMELGKGLRPAIPRPPAVAAPPLSRCRCRRRLMPAPRARPLAVKPAAAFDDEDSSGDESSGDEALSRAEAKAAAKAAAHRAQARRVEKRRTACLEVWGKMSEDEQDAFVAAFLLPNGPIEKQERAPSARSTRPRRPPRPRACACTTCPAPSRCCTADPHDDQQGPQPLPLQDAEG